MTKPKRRVDPQRAENLAKALADLENMTYRNPNEAAIVTGAEVSTIYRRLHGQKSRRDANVDSQALTPTEEYSLVQWAQHAESMGHPLRHQFLRELAEELRKKPVKLEGKLILPLGKEWVHWFLKRIPVLKSQLSKSIEKAWAEVTKEEVQAWFKAFKSVIQEEGVLEENIYNMDETGSWSYFRALNDIEGFNIGIHGKNSYVICSAKEKQIYAAEPGRTEWVTVVECICADGTAINPLIIFKGENLQTV